MGQNEQTKPREQIVESPININKEEHNSNTLTNQTGRSSCTSIIICIIFVITGQSIARLLETFHYHHNTYQSLHNGVWTQPFLQAIGFPLLILPFIFLSSKKHNQLLITSHRSSLAVLYFCTGVIIVVQVRLYVKGKLEVPFTKFILLDGTQLYFTMVFAGLVNRIKLEIWIVISLFFTVAISILSSSVGGECSALLAAITFSFILCNIQRIFHNFISTSNSRKPRFADVLELLIFSSLFATVAAFFISDESLDLKREMYGFSKGMTTYVMTMVGQAAAWQIYWVGIVGLVLFIDSVVTSNVGLVVYVDSILTSNVLSLGPVVYADSIVTSNVVSLFTLPIVMVLNILFCNYEEDEFDGSLGAALALSAICVASCFYKHIRVLRDIGNWKPPTLLLFVVFFCYVLCLLV